ncbi:MAG: HEAT repeat domain-containing protein [Candidatus Sericytochromatia bacterium]
MFNTEIYLAWLLLLSAVIGVTAVICLVLVVGLRRRNKTTAQRWQELEKRWDHLLPSVLAGQVPPETLRERIAPDEHLFWIDYLYHHASHLPVRDPAYLPYQRLLGLAAPDLQPIFERAAAAEPELRARALETLGKLAPESSRPLLIAALDDASLHVAFTALRSLVELHQLDTVAPIVRVLPRFSDFNADFIASLLAQLSPTATLPLLLTPIYSAQTPLWERTVALCTLQRWPRQAAEVAGLRALALDVSQATLIRALSLRVLTQWQAVSDIRSVIYAFAADDTEVLRVYAMHALGQLRLEDETELLELGMSDPSRWVALEAANALERMEHPPDPHDPSINHPVVTLLHGLST